MKRKQIPDHDLETAAESEDDIDQENIFIDASDSEEDEDAEFTRFEVKREKEDSDAKRVCDFAQTILEHDALTENTEEQTTHTVLNAADKQGKSDLFDSHLLATISGKLELTDTQLVSQLIGNDTIKRSHVLLREGAQLFITEDSVMTFSALQLIGLYEVASSDFDFLLTLSKHGYKIFPNMIGRFKVIRNQLLLRACCQVEICLPANSSMMPRNVKGRHLNMIWKRSTDS